MRIEKIWFDKVHKSIVHVTSSGRKEVKFNIKLRDEWSSQFLGYIEDYFNANEFDKLQVISNNTYLIIKY